MLILRRLKSEVMADLPQGRDSIPAFDESHKASYNWMLEEISKQRANIKNAKSISSMFAELRQAANHHFSCTNGTLIEWTSCRHCVALPDLW